MGINVGKVFKEIATNKNTIVKETNQLRKGLGSGADPTKAMESFMENNKDNPEVLNFMEELNSAIQNKPTVRKVTKAIDSGLNNYVPLENGRINIVTNSGTKTITLKDLPPEAVKAVSKLYGEKKLLNRNLGISAGDVNIYDPKLTDTLVSTFNKDIKKPEIISLVEGNPVNKDAIAKLLYNAFASASYGSAGYDTAQVVNRFNGNSENGNPDNIWTNPKVIGLTSALTRFAFPLVKQLANVPVNANTLARIADLTVPAAVGKVVNHATTPDPTPSKPWEESAVKTMNKVVGKGNPKPKNNPNNPVIPGNNWDNW